MLKTATGTLASRVLGLVRDVLTARYFGTTAVTDVFFMANSVPNLFRRLFGEGALNSCFVPVFTGELKRSEEDGRRLLNTVMTALAALLSAIMLVGWLVCAAALLSGRLPPNGRTFFLLLAIQLPYLPLICLTALQAVALNVKGHFLRVAFAPTLMNLAWITAVLLFRDRTQESAMIALAVAVTVSGLLQFAWQAQMLWRQRMAFRWAWDLAHPGLREIAALMLPAVLGLGVVQVNAFVDQLIAKFLVPEAGANSALFYGNHLMQFPLGVLGIALATAVFPAFARCAADGDRRGLVDAVNLSMRTALFISLPCVAALLVLGEPMVRVLFQHGEFTARSAERTAAVLACFGVGLWAFCGVQVFGRVFYALKKPQVVVRIAAVCVAVNLALNLTLVWPMREAGLALSSSIAGMVNLGLLFLHLRREAGLLGGRRIAWSGVKCALASALAGGAAWAALRLLAPHVGRDGAVLAGRTGDIVALAAALAALALIFLLASQLLRVSELGEFVQALRSRKATASARPQ